MSKLAETLAIKTISETAKSGVFEIAGLYTGYGLTLGNALRRVLLSSLPGAAITRMKIKGVPHEFSTLPGMTEDIMEFTLNLKKVRLILYGPEPQTLQLRVKGIKEVTAGDIETTAQAEIINPDLRLTSLTTKNAELDMELTVEPGLGYVPVEAGKGEKLAIGVIALDAIFSPVTRINFTVENMRVGERTDYNRLKIMIDTDGTITPSAALKEAANILHEHFVQVAGLEVKAVAAPVLVKAARGRPAKKVKKAAAKTKKK